MEGRCSCDPAKELFSAGCVYGDPRPTPPGCARVVVCRVATSPYKCSSEYHHIAETDMGGVNVLTFTDHSLLLARLTPHELKAHRAFQQ